MNDSVAGESANVPSPGTVQMLLASAVLYRPREIEPRDSVLLVALELGLSVFYPEFLVADAAYDLSRAASADIQALANTITLGGPVAAYAGLSPPPHPTYEDRFYWALDQLADWMESLQPGNQRSRAVHAIRREIESTHLVGPDIEETMARVIAILCGNIGEDYDPEHRRPLNGEFALAGLDHEQRWALVQEFLKEMPRWGEWTRDTGNWERGLIWTGRGITIDKDVHRAILDRVLGKGRAKSSCERPIDPDLVPGPVGRAEATFGPETLLEIRELRDSLEDCELLQEMLDRLVGGADADSVEIVMGVVERIGSEYQSHDDDQPLQAALLYELQLGTRESLADRLGVTVEAIRYRKDRAKEICAKLSVA